MDPNYNKRSISNAKPKEKKDEKKLHFSDLGLKTQIPSILLKTVKERKEEKFLKKKEHQKRTKEAFEQLSKYRTEVEMQREYFKKTQQEEKIEKEKYKKNMKIQQLAAQNKNKQEEKQRDTEFLKKQSVIVENKLREDVEKARKLRETEKIIQDQVRQEIKKADVAIHINVKRKPEIEKVRASLPVIAEEQPIMEAILENSASIIIGETGSGKTTQVPQFLWEAGFSHLEGRPLGRQGMIAVTEPRRVAAVSMAKRVAEELNEEFGNTVCYHVRYDNNLSENCKLKFVTEGIILKEIQSDFLLRQYSVVICDEAHERSVSCDVLLGLLTRITQLRQQLYEEQRQKYKENYDSLPDNQMITPLKLVIMSATLRVSDFRDNNNLFLHPPPVVSVDARRFPVTAHFARKTELFKYVQEAFKKVRQIHKRLPPGAILVFLATQREIEQLCKLLQEFYARTRIRYESGRYGKHALVRKRQDDAKRECDDVPEEDEYGLAADEYGLNGDEDGPEENSTQTVGLGEEDDYDYGGDRGIESDDEDANGPEERVARAFRLAKNYIKRSADQMGGGGTEKKKKHSEQTVLHGLEENDDWDEFNSAEDAEEKPEPTDEVETGVNEDDELDGHLDSLHVLPLYALLDSSKQQLVFEPPPEGKRLCIVATNVAETSITIPNVRYVVDSGRVKTKVLEEDTGASSYRIEWTSQASSEQRSGRAGRTSAGHCYRLYSTAVYANRMPQHTPPEILRTPLESVVLMMKHLKIDHVGRFPFPTPPSAEAIRQALQHLVRLQALTVPGAASAPSYRITPLGTFLMKFPVPPRYARMIFEVLRLAPLDKRLRSYVVALVATIATTVGLFSPVDSKEQLENQRGLLHSGSDAVTALRAFGAFLQDATSRGCTRYGLVHKSMLEAYQLKVQLDAVVAQIEREAGDPDNGDKDLSNLQESTDAVETVGVRALSSDSSKFERHFFGPHGELVLEREKELLLRKIVALGLCDQVARRASVSECTSQGFRFTEGRKTTTVPFRDCRSGRIVFVHPTSSIARTTPPPEWVVYCVLQKTKRKMDEKDTEGVFLEGGKVRATEKLYMKGVTIMTKTWLDEIQWRESDIEEK